MLFVITGEAAVLHVRAFPRRCSLPHNLNQFLGGLPLTFIPMCRPLLISVTRLVIVPDYFDVFHLWEKGYEQVVAAVGSDWYAAQVRLILRSLPNQRFVILGDETDHGREWRTNTARLFCPFAYTRVLEFAEEGRLVGSLTPQEIKEEL